MGYHSFVCSNCGGQPRGDNGAVCDVCEGQGSRGSFEVYFAGAHCNDHPEGSVSCHECAMNSGWYWWSCFPGCLPDGDAFGPFATEQEAINDANACD